MLIKQTKMILEQENIAESRYVIDRLSIEFFLLITLFKSQFEWINLIISLSVKLQ